MKIELALKKLLREYNKTLNTNGTVNDFLKSLPSDNTILAGIICQNSSNETITK